MLAPASQNTHQRAAFDVAPLQLQSVFFFPLHIYLFIISSQGGEKERAPLRTGSVRTSRHFGPGRAKAERWELSPKSPM